jgi:hypothetical protein
MVERFPSVLDRAGSDDLKTSPFPHLLIESALPSSLYNELSATFPRMEYVTKGKSLGNNKLHLLSGSEAMEVGGLSDVWRQFMSEHLRPEFFRRALEFLKTPLYCAYPDLDKTIGCTLDSARLASRSSNQDCEIFFDVQFGINSPVEQVSRVRGAHVDKPVKLFNALLYMREKDDISPGGDLGLYTFKGPRSYHKNTEILDDVIDLVGNVPYEANTFMLFMNSPDSIHGVTPRGLTPKPRRYINFLAEAKAPLFEVVSDQMASHAPAGG